jgi:hypothetical protein
MITPRKRVTARSAWRPREFPDRDAYTVALNDAHLAVFDSALAANRAAGRRTMLHNRTAFEDHSDPELKRHLLRLWLMLDGRRPLAPAVHAYKGTQGIVGRHAGSTYYTGLALPDRY